MLSLCAETEWRQAWVVAQSVSVDRYNELAAKRRMQRMLQIKAEKIAELTKASRLTPSTRNNVGCASCSSSHPAPSKRYQEA